MTRFLTPLALCTAMAFAASASAELLLYEPFGYTAGADLVGQNGGTGFTGAWRDGAAGGGIIQAGSLPAPAGVPTAGGHALLSGAAGTYQVYRDFTNIEGADGETTWISWIAQRQGDSIPTPDPTYGDNPYPRGVNAGFFNTEHPTRPERVGIGNSSNATENEWSIIPEGSGGLREGSGVPWDEMHWAVMRLDHHGDINTPDDAYLWLDPDPNVEPDIMNALASSVGVVDFSGLDFIRPFVGNESSGRPAGQMVIDEIRVGTTYADMSAVPEPAALCLAGLAACGLVGRRRR